MKVLSYFTLAVLLLATACKKDNNNNNNNNSGTGKPFYCKLNGTEFIPGGGGRFYITPMNTIQIVGDTTFTTIEIYVSKSDVGEYTLASGTPSASNNIASVYINDGNKAYISTSGKVKITKSDGSKISGTFQYDAKDASGNVMHVTDGAFNGIEKH